MHARTIALFLGIVAALGALAWWQLERESAGGFDARRPLLESFDPSRVTRLRVDNIERDVQLTIERDAGGTWTIVDPFHYPAEPAILAMLFDVLTTNPTVAVKGAEPARLGLVPPRAVLELSEEGSAGAPRRVEIGAVDLDGQSVFARVDGVVVRTLRSLDTALERDLLGWRRLAIFDVAPRSIVELRRSGKVTLSAGAEPVDLALDALDEGGWRSRSPQSVRLDPGAVGIVLTSLATLRAAGFIDDAPVDLSPYGLDEPDLRFEIATARDERLVLRFARMPDGADWYALVEGRPNVYRVAVQSLLPLTGPSELLYDRELLRTVRDRIASVRLVADDRETLLARRGYTWTVSESRAGMVTLAPAPAESARVEDLLGGLEQGRVLEFVPGAAISSADAPAAFFVESEGETQGGSFGPLQRTADGEGQLFLRQGDTLCSVVSPKLLELARTSASELRSLDVFSKQERDVAKIRVALGGERRTYERRANGLWCREGSEVEAREFGKLVERLLRQRAVRHLAPGETADALEDAIDVVVVEPSGRDSAYRLGVATLLAPPTDGDPAATKIVVCDVGGPRAQVEPDAHRELADLLRRP